MTDADIDTQETEEEEEPAKPNYAVLIPIGIGLGVPGLLLLVMALLAGLKVSLFSGLLASLSALVGFYPRDMVYVVGAVGLSLLLAGLATTLQGLQKASPQEDNEEEEEEAEPEAE
jgi:hypothetical protein